MKKLFLLVLAIVIFASFAFASEVTYKKGSYGELVTGTATIKPGTLIATYDTSEDALVIKEVKVGIVEPTYGNGFDRNPTFETQGIVFDHIYWEGFELTGIQNTWVGQNNDTDKAIETKYRATIYFTLKEGYSIEGLEENMAEKNIGVVNDKTGLLVRNSKPLYYIKTPTYEVKQPEDVVEITSMTITLDEPVVGEPLPKACKASNSIFPKEVSLEIPCNNSNGYTISWNLSYHPAVQAGTDYLLNVRYALDGAAVAEKFSATVNGKKASFEQNGNYLVVTYKFTTPKEEAPKEKEMINQFSIKVDAPEIGKAPSKKATAVTKGFSIDKVTWTPNDKEFKEGVAYKVKVYVSPDEGKDIRSDYFGLVNGAQAKMPNDYDENNFYVEYMFPRLETPATWASASKWALDELAKAKEAGLIPTVLDKEDFTKNITRKEFAHVAVRLYEKVAGELAEPAKNNPFTDTNDEEILKAYNLGITQGMSATTFEPDTLITREQMATMMTRALAKAGVDTSVDMAFVEKFADDASFGKWYVESIYFMASNGIIKGVGDNKFDPQGQASREASLLISVRSAESFGI